MTRPELLLWTDHGWSIYYAPFERVNPAAKVLVVGLTPGRHQMWEATMAAARALREDRSIPEALEAAERTGAFAGRMRSNLVCMLDQIGVAKWLGLDSTELLWTDDAARELVSATSAVVHPLFQTGDKNYGGNLDKDARRFPILAAFIDQVLAADVEFVAGALVVPPGVSVNRAVSRLAIGGLDQRRVLDGFPHPSPGNPNMKRQFEASKVDLTERVAAWSATHHN